VSRGKIDWEGEDGGEKIGGIGTFVVERERANVDAVRRVRDINGIFPPYLLSYYCCLSPVYAGYRTIESQTTPDRKLKGEKRKNDEGKAMFRASRSSLISCICLEGRLLPASRPGGSVPMG
jgi:hypothetical protein